MEKVKPFGENGCAGKQAENAAKRNLEARRVGCHVFGFANEARDGKKQADEVISVCPLWDGNP